jgi:hypothetical protein
VHDHGKPLTVAYSGGTKFNFVNDVPHFDSYLASVRKFAAIAAAARATIIMGNQSQFDGPANKLRMLADGGRVRRILWTLARLPRRAMSKLKMNARKRCGSNYSPSKTIAATQKHRWRCCR